MPPSYVLTLDIGTSSTRALLFDATATAHLGVLAHIANQPQIAPAGDVIFDLDSLFASVVAVIDTALAQAELTGAPIGAVAIDTFVTNIAGLDGSGVPVTPVLTYAHPSSAAAVEELRAELGADGAAAVHERTGCLLHSSYLPTRFRWMAQAHPEWLASSRHWLSVGEYLLWRLTGVRRASYSVAAWSGLLDRRRLVWDQKWLQMLPIDAEQLAPLGDVGDVVVGLRPEWAQRWPALARVPWLPAVGDGAAANVGSGCADGRHVALTLGTTGAMRVVVPPDLAALPAGLWLYRVTGNLGLLGGATTEGGSLPAWLRAVLQLPTPEVLEASMRRRPPGAHGLTLLPFLAGERAPGWNDRAGAALAGMTLATTPEDIYQAALEAVAYRFALIYAAMAPHLPAEAEIVASGGALAASPAWAQIFADVLNRPITLLAEKELACHGTALLALQQLGQIATLSDLPPAVERVYHPDPARHAVHRQALAEQVGLYGRLLGG